MSLILKSLAIKSLGLTNQGNGMADAKYDIYFRGEILPGYDEEQVKASIAHIFKASNQTLEQLFSGKTNAIKQAVDKPTAVKYQQAFKKAGAKSVITLSKSIDERGESMADSNRGEESREGVSWEVLPAGSDLLKPNERRMIPDANVDVSQIEMVSPFAEINVEEEMVPAAPETAHISIADIGEGIGSDGQELTPELELDLSEFSVAEVGVNLVDLKEEEVPSPPDVSHIKLV